MLVETAGVPGAFARLPPWARAVVAALSFHRADPEPLHLLNGREWDRALAFAARARLALLLAHLRGPDLPARIRDRIERDRARNAQRLGKLRSALVEILSRLEAAQVDYVLLKGFAHGGDFNPAPDVRMHYDIDLYCPGSGLHIARDRILQLGYEPLPGLENFPTDHLPVMVRRSGWQWKGDLFDPEIPPSVDLHFRLWDEETECFGAPGLAGFWERRVWRDVGGRRVATFCDADLLGYASLHLLRHLLRGSASPLHVYEIAHFLHVRRGDDAWWSRWKQLHAPELRGLEAIAFELARRWFGCLLPAEAQRETEALPAAIRRWTDLYAAAPLETQFRPNKSEIWLHLCLVDSAKGKRAVLRRRLAPLRLPAPVDSPFTPTPRVRRMLRYGLHVLRRFGHHVRVLPGLAVEAAAWFLGRGTAPRRFLLFLIAANTFGFGVFVFVLLYNLLLLDLGFREDFLGAVNGAMLAGNTAGALLMPPVARRFGLKKALVLGSALTPAVFALRAAAASPEFILAGAVAGGLALSLWMTSLSPSVASLTDERRRPAGFSLWIGTGIATGIAGGFLGSRLPGWISSAGLAQTGAGAKTAAILCGCAISLLSLVPLSRLALSGGGATESRLYPSGRFVARYLAAFAVWSLAVGAFNPFFNAYFARRFGAGLEQIGGIYSAAQGVQALGIAAAPLLLARTGLPSGTAMLQVAAALALASLAAAPVLSAAAAIYAWFMTFQVMCEPGMFSLLMNRVKPEERAGASALNSLAMFGAQALAAAGAGWAFLHFGFPATLSAAAGLALLSAWLFRRLG